MRVFFCTPCRHISPYHGGTRCTPHTWLSPFREGRACTLRTCLSASREGNRYTPSSLFSGCREGRESTPRSCNSPCRWGTGSTLRSSLSASRANIACLSSRPPDLVVAHTSVRTASLLSVPRRAAEKSEGKVVALDPRENRQFSSEHPRGRRCPPHTSTSLVLVLHDVRIIIVTPVTKLG